MSPFDWAWLVVLLFCWCSPHGNADKFTLGYLTGASRRPWDKEYSRPGLSISGKTINYRCRCGCVCKSQLLLWQQSVYISLTV